MQIFLGIISLFVLISGPIIFLGVFWNFYCTNKTYKQRNALIRAMFSQEDAMEGIIRRELYNDVPYDEHAKYLETFRDPWQLYKSKTFIRDAQKILREGR